YDRSLIDVFKIQDEIASEVSEALHAKLAKAAPADGHQPDLRAYNLVLEGNYFRARRTGHDVEKAIQLYRRAIDLSPGYALAWARLAGAYFTEEILTGVPSDAQSNRVLAALERSLELDPNLVPAYYTRGGFEMNIKWNWAAAQADAERMREIDPRFDLLPRAFGELALLFGDADKAAALYKALLERSPLDPYTLDDLCTALCAASRFAECLEARLRLLQLHPEYGGANQSVGLARLYLGQLPEALAAMQREPNEEYRLAGLAMVYAEMGRHAESDTALQALVQKFGTSDAYTIAEIHAYRGEIDEAFGWLDRAYRLHNFSMVGLRTDPLLRNLHEDRRFRGLLSRMKLIASR